MILNKPRKCRFVVCVLAAIGLFVVAAGVAKNAGSPVQPPQTPAAGGRQAGGSNAHLRELMIERYEVLKSLVESLEKLRAAGRVSPAEWRDATADLYAAKAALCTDSAERIKVYEEMVEFLRVAEEQTRQGVIAGMINETELKHVRIATIEAQIALERTRLGQTP